MARMTLRVPDSLHALLAECAKREGVSMNQYVVFALSRITTIDDVARQRSAFASLLRRFPEEEAEAALQQVLGDREASK
jgi:hypothetical protein